MELTDKQKQLIKTAIDNDRLCKYCTWTKKGYVNNAMGMCEGRWCDEASVAYLEDIEEERI
jgi:hypothetical protein